MFIRSCTTCSKYPCIPNMQILKTDFGNCGCRKYQKQADTKSETSRP